jgi:hypothetical protein
MRHHSPKVNNPIERDENPGRVHADELVGHVLRNVVQRHVSNPAVEAILEEMGPEIDGVLRQVCGGSTVDLEQLQNGLNRAGRVMQRVANGRRTA